jgi:hypothetical protein
MMREQSEARLKVLIQADFQKILERLLDVTMDVEPQRKQAPKLAMTLSLEKRQMEGQLPGPDEAGGDPDDAGAVAGALEGPGAVAGPDEAGGTPDETGTVTEVSLDLILWKYMDQKRQGW